MAKIFSECKNITIKNATNKENIKYGKRLKNGQKDHRKEKRIVSKKFPMKNGSVAKVSIS